MVVANIRVFAFINNIVVLTLIQTIMIIIETKKCSFYNTKFGIV